MRAVRAVLLGVVLSAVTQVVARAAAAPLAEGRRALEAGTGHPEHAASELTAMLTGGCALLLVTAWLWLLAAVGVCTADALRRRSAALPPSVLRPPLVRAVVATVLGAAALSSAPAAHAGSPATHGIVVPRDLVDDSPVGHPSGRGVLAGLPVPDRSVGRLTDRSEDHAGDRTGGRTGGRTRDRTEDGAAETSADPVRRLQVRPGDSLWTLTAGLLPAGAAAGTVVAGWRLLYAANRAVVGPDPDLLLPGQSLVVGPALLDLLTAAGAPMDAGRRAPAR